MTSICPMSGQPCRGPACPLLVSYAQEDGGFLYYCGLNRAIPEGGTAWEIIPASAGTRANSQALGNLQKKTAPSATNTKSGKETQHSDN